MTVEVTHPLIRFERKVSPEPNTGCWIWDGAIGGDGYGRFAMGPRRMVHRYQRAHRAAWLLYRGAIPGGLYVLHGCDNRWCVNPDHLRLGTQSENIMEMHRKGRASPGQLHRRTA